MGDRDMSRQLTSGVLGRKKTLANDYIKRVIADGGVVINEQHVKDLFRNLNLDELQFYWDLNCGVRIENGQIAQGYDLSQNQNDLFGSNCNFTENKGAEVISGVVTTMKIGIPLWNRQYHRIKIDFEPTQLVNFRALFTNGADIVSLPGVGHYFYDNGSTFMFISDGITRQILGVSPTSSIVQDEVNEIDIRWSGIANSEMTSIINNTETIVTPTVDFENSNQSYILFGGNRSMVSTLGVTGYISKIHITN